MVDSDRDKDASRKDQDHPQKGQDKGKNKAEYTQELFVDRLRTSIKAMLGVLADPGYLNDMPNYASTGKAHDSSSASNWTFPLHQEANTYRARPNPEIGSERQGKSIKQGGNAYRASKSFDDFLGQVSLQPVLAFDALSSPHEMNAVAQQQVSDGRAVLDLLSHPDELTWELEPNNEDQVSPATAQILRKALFSEANENQLPWDHLLNFTPDFVRDPESRKWDQKSVSSAMVYTGTTDIEEARGLWLRQWSDVLSAYTDQVWGNLKPLVAQAKLETREQDEPTHENKALNRLRQILSHVRSGRGKDVT